MNVIIQLAERLLGRLGGAPVRVELWDGSVVGDPDGRWVLRLTERAVLTDLARDFDRGAAEAFCRGALRVEGDLPELLEAAFRAGVGRPSGFKLLRRLRHDRKRAAAAAAHHYDVGNDFYRLWLDPELVYTCAFFPRPDDDLATAQRAKMDRVCRKLALRPGETVVEAGAGWGALSLHMAEHYGVRVRAWNVAQEQVAWSREQAARRGLADRVEFVLDDWRAIPRDGAADAFVSVGMLEHVGPAQYEELGAVAAGTLTPQGRGLIHSIGRARPRPMHPWIEERIFPNAHPPSLAEMMGIFEPNDLVTLDVENLRRHYARTLRLWHDNYLDAWDEVVAEVGEERARAWLLYLAGSCATFRVGGLELFQVVFARAGSAAIPWIRPG